MGLHQPGTFQPSLPRRPRSVTTSVQRTTGGGEGATVHGRSNGERSTVKTRSAIASSTSEKTARSETPKTVRAEISVLVDQPGDGPSTMDLGVCVPKICPAGADYYVHAGHATCKEARHGKPDVNHSHLHGGTFRPAQRFRPLAGKGGNRVQDFGRVRGIRTESW